MNTILLANILAFIGAMMMVGIGLVKKKKQILLAQCAQFMVLGAANMLLGGMTGLVSNLISIARNLFCLKWDYTTKWKVIFIGVQVVLSMGVNTLGLLGWFPIFSTVLFTWFLDLKNEVHLKIVIITAQIFWIIYDFNLHNYVTFIFGIMTVCSNLLGIVMILKDRRAEKAIK